jgi:hypothetical protein
MSELYRLSDRSMSAKLVPTFTDRGCRVVSARNPYGRILEFLDRCNDLTLDQIKIPHILKYSQNNKRLHISTEYRDPMYVISTVEFSVLPSQRIRQQRLLFRIPSSYFGTH